MPAIPIPQYVARNTPQGSLNIDPRSIDTGWRDVASGASALIDSAFKFAESRAGVQDAEAIVQERDAAADDAVALPETRTAARALYEEHRKAAPADAKNFAGTFRTALRNLTHKTVEKGRTERSRNFRRAALANLEEDLFDEAKNYEVATWKADRFRKLDQGLEQAAVNVEADPRQYLPSVAEHIRSLELLDLPEADVADRRQSTLHRLAIAAASGAAQSQPDALLVKLRDPSVRDGVLDQLTLADRLKLEGVAEGAQESQRAESILAVYRQDFRQGSRELAALPSSGLPPERQDAIRRRVREGVNLLQDERRQTNVDARRQLEQGIGTGANVAQNLTLIDSLYRRGALTPSEYANLGERVTIAATNRAAEGAVAAEITAALRDGVPLDPTSSAHRKFLDTAFAVDAGKAPPGSEPWQALALSYAGRARMLPTGAGSWLRSAARSPDAKLAVNAAEFFGGLEATSPEAAGGVDPQTRAFLASLSAMTSAGTPRQAAFETARANVFETRRDVVEQRQQRYTQEAKGNLNALNRYIDRDFDPVFGSQPAASVTLQADFDRQAGEYFTKVGDIELARDLAWKDIARVYGPSRINGDPVVMAFPPERYGISPEEIRAELAGVVGPERAQGLIVVPDSLTLRQVSDALTGEPVMPSYRLVTPEGDLVADGDGTPLRYTLPNGDELARRVDAAQRQAAADAQAHVASVKARRDLVERARENPLAIPMPSRN